MSKCIVCGTETLGRICSSECDNATPAAPSEAVACGNCGHAKAGHAESEGGCANDFCDCGLVPCGQCGTLSQIRPAPAPRVTEADAIVRALAHWSARHLLPSDNELAMVCETAMKYASRAALAAEASK